MPRTTRLLVRGLTRRCPNCGGRGIFRRWLQMRERCPTCAMQFAREEGFFLGAFVLNFGLVLLVLGVWVVGGVIATQPDPPIVTLSVLGIVISTAIAILFYPSSKSLWCAIDMIMDPETRQRPERAR